MRAIALLTALLLFGYVRRRKNFLQGADAHTGWKGV